MKDKKKAMEMVDVIELAASSEHGTHMVVAMSKVREAMHLICSFHKVDSREPVDERERTHEEPFLVSVYLVISGPPYNGRSSREVARSHYNVLTSKGMVDGIMLCKQMMRPETLVYLTFSALQLGKWYKNFVNCRGEKESDSGEAESSATREDGGKSKKFSKSTAFRCTLLER